MPHTQTHTQTQSHFTLTRHLDGLTYHFEALSEVHGKPAYQRADADLWIHWHPAWGWVAMGEDGDPSGQSFSTPRSLQNGRPPQGLWVSRKGAKSYVYDLRWAGEP